MRVYLILLARVNFFYNPPTTYRPYSPLSARPMMSLYPLIKPYAEHRLSVASPHCLYIEESGNAEGIPVLFVHGGPGSGCDARARSFFDPLRYRIIAFDQRGAGQSTPHAELQGNDSGALVEDMEQIREYLGIEQWLLFGGSWGTTLSLIYAQAHPQRVLALIMRGVFLCRQQDLHWLYQQGASHIFPDFWEDFLRPIAPLFDLPMSSFTRGDKVQNNLRANGYNLLPAICYEIVFADLVRGNYKSDSDLLFTVSNDAWFGDSIGPLQHMQIARMRALELQRPLVRVTNNGVSAVYDPISHAQQTMPQFEATILRANIKLIKGDSVYSQYGNVFVWGLVFLMGLSGFGVRFRK